MAVRSYPVLFAEHSGHQIMVTAVRRVEDGVEVALQVKRSALTARQEAHHEARTRKWAADVSNGIRQPPPEDPADFLNHLELRLSDDLGTPYRWSLTWGGGTGVEWQGAWKFRPEMPPGAARFFVDSPYAVAGALEVNREDVQCSTS